MVEKALVDSGIILLKYWLEVTPQEQERRLRDRIDDGRKIWKLSPWTSSPSIAGMTTPGRGMPCSSPPTPPGPLVRGPPEDKKRVRLNIISHLLAHIPYEALPAEPVKLPKRKIGKVKPSDHPLRIVPALF